MGQKKKNTKGWREKRTRQTWRQDVTYPTKKKRGGHTTHPKQQTPKNPKKNKKEKTQPKKYPPPPPPNPPTPPRGTKEKNSNGEATNKPTPTRGLCEEVLSNEKLKNMWRMRHESISAFGRGGVDHLEIGRGKGIMRAANGSGDHTLIYVERRKSGSTN